MGSRCHGSEEIDRRGLACGALGTKKCSLTIVQESMEPVHLRPETGLRVRVTFVDLKVDLVVTCWRVQVYDINYVSILRDVLVQR